MPGRALRAISAAPTRGQPFTADRLFCAEYLGCKNSQELTLDSIRVSRGQAAVPAPTPYLPASSLCPYPPLLPPLVLRAGERKQYPDPLLVCLSSALQGPCEGEETQSLAEGHPVSREAHSSQTLPHPTFTHSPVLILTEWTLQSSNPRLSPQKVLPDLTQRNKCQRGKGN